MRNLINYGFKRKDFALWNYNVPSPIIVTKKCKVNGTTRSSNIELSHICIWKEELSVFFSEAFILLPVSDGFANVSLTSSQLLPLHLPERMSPEKRRQITYDELQTRRTLAALEEIGSRH
jgi:hypothetical protein